MPTAETRWRPLSLPCRSAESHARCCHMCAPVSTPNAMPATWWSIAGSCVRIEASVIKNTNRMADQLQAVYIIPAPDGCRVVREHCYITESEGFFRRFDHMLNTLSVFER